MSEVLKDFSANIDLKQSLVNEDVKVVEGDNGNVLVLNIVKDGDPVDLTDCLVQIVFAHSGRTVWQDSSSPSGGITISGAENNIVTVRLHSDSYAPNGITVCQVKVYSGAGQTTLVSSARFSFKAELSLLNAETVESIEQYSILVTLIETVNGMLDRDQADWDETDNLKVSYIRNKPVVGTDVQDATQNLTAETTLSDADTVPFYDQSITGHRKTTWSNIKAKLFDAIYPVGAIYMSVVPTSPATLFGGTWAVWGTGRVPVGVNTAEVEFATVELTGGAKIHTLTTSEMPSHTHQQMFGNGAGALSTAQVGSFASFGGAATGSAGNGVAHNNLQPYITCYFWKRTA